MKKKKLFVSLVVALFASALTAAGQSKSVMPLAPAGDLVATPSVVQTGTYPTLSWRIAYPANIGRVATIDKGVITLKKRAYVSVKPIGVGVTGSYANATSSNVESRISVDGGSYEQLFYGTNDNVDPTHTLYNKQLNAGTNVSFGGRYVEDGTWKSFYTGNSSNLRVIALKSGDTIPTTYDLKENNRLAEYLKPYTDGSGKVKVGPTSAIVLMEVAADSSRDLNFDYQDVALLVNVSDKNNNGHGNNVDGVDSSNPGNGSGGPNGSEDPSGGVDDEIK